MKKIRINKFPLKDLINFIKVSILRNKAINNASDKKIDENIGQIPQVNILHPQNQQLIITKITKENTNTLSIYLERIDGENVAYFKPGQFISLTFNIDGFIVTRPYSISSSPNDKYYRITVKKVENGFVSDYIFHHLKEGDKITSSSPSGQFYYEELRDNKNIIAIAGGSGITPFMSMANAIIENKLDINLTIIYGNKTEEDIIFKDELLSLENKSNKIKVIHVLSNEKSNQYEHGFISKEIIEKYAPIEAYSIFVCGPIGLFNFLNNELEKMNLVKKNIRYELMSSHINLENQDNYPLDCLNKTFTITVHINEKTYKILGKSEDSILVSLEKSKIIVPSLCRSGVCGLCHSKLINGTIFINEKTDRRRKADIIYNYIHPCVSYPTSDIEISIPPIKN